MNDDYKLCNVLNFSTLHKSINLLYVKKDIEIPKFDNEDQFQQWCKVQLDSNPDCFSIDLIQKSNFDVDLIKHSNDDFNRQLTDQVVLELNDIYQRYLFQSNVASQIQMNRIRPCTLIHILKYSSTNSKRLKETPELYTTVVKPYIESIPKNRTSWIANLFNGVSEQESILCKESDPLSGFLILPDSKWDKVSVNQLYLLVITENVDIKSLRDLNDTHILLLQQIQAKTLAVLKEKYGIGWEDVRLFVHYQPSYYQFHIHVVHSQIQGLDGAQVGQAHLLEDIIDNINLDKDYYKKKTLSYFLSTNHPLFTLLQNE